MSQDLDSESLILRQVDRVLRTASMDLDNKTNHQGDTVMDLEKYSFVLMVSTSFLDQLTEPLKDEETAKQTEQLTEDADLDHSIGKLNYARDLFGKNVEVLRENDLLFESSASFVLEEGSENMLMESEEIV